MRVVLIIPQSFFCTAFLFIIFFYSGSCSARTKKPEIVLVGSTPGDESVKSMLSIPAESKIDFIRWNLKLNDKSLFVLDIVYGESQPNTLGFIGGGEKSTLSGKYTVSRTEGIRGFKEVYHLQRDGLPGIFLVKLNDNLFHLLNPQGRLMTGNGGWSYSLNRKNRVSARGIMISSSASDTQSLQLVFDGRTPCAEMAAEHPEMKASPDCFKLKWRLILNRDSLSHLPADCTIRKVVDNQPRDVSGKWSITHGTATNPHAIIYTIDTGKPSESISLLAGDDHVLFFLDKNNELFVGNGDFSYTLNKRIQTEGGE